jgi:hypothetical protein
MAVIKRATIADGKFIWELNKSTSERKFCSFLTMYKDLELYVSFVKNTAAKISYRTEDREEIRVLFSGM